MAKMSSLSLFFSTYDHAVGSIHVILSLECRCPQMWSSNTNTRSPPSASIRRVRTRGTGSWICRQACSSCTYTCRLGVHAYIARRGVGGVGGRRDGKGGEGGGCCGGLPFFFSISTAMCVHVHGILWSSFRYPRHPLRTDVRMPRLCRQVPGRYGISVGHQHYRILSTFTHRR